MSVAPSWTLPTRWRHPRQRRSIRRWLNMARFEEPTAASPPPAELPRALQGEYHEYEAFFWRFQHKVYGYLLRMVNDPDTARDLCQETFSTRLMPARGRSPGSIQRASQAATAAAMAQR